MAERWKAYVETLKEGVDKAQFSAADRQDSRAVRDGRGLPRPAQAGRDGGQRLQPDPDHPARQPRRGRRAGGAVRGDEALARADRDPAQEGGVVVDPGEKVALYLRVANLYLEKFSNQAEAIKSFETALELEPDNEQAATFLRQMYEKRRDWDKLVALARSETGRVQDPEARRLRRIEVARLASEKLKKPAISIELWSEVLAEKDDDEDALGELEKLYEREKAWAELGDVLERQAALLPVGAPGRVAAEAGAAVHREAAGRGQGGRRLARAAGSRAGQPAGAGRASQDVHRAAQLGRARAILLRAGQVGRVRPRAGTPGRGRGRPASRSACRTRSASCTATG